MLEHVAASVGHRHVRGSDQVGVAQPLPAEAMGDHCHLIQGVPGPDVVTPGKSLT